MLSDIESWSATATPLHWLMAPLIFAQIALGSFAARWRISRFAREKR
jgi:cytochrome b561